MAYYSSWTTPIDQLPKDPHQVEGILRDMADNQEELAQKMQECIRKLTTVENFFKSL